VIGEIKRHFRDRVWAVRVPRPIKDISIRIPRETERLTGVLGRAPTIAELAEALSTDEESVIEAFEARHAYNTISLTAPGGNQDDDTDLIDQLGEEESGYERAEDWAALRAGLENLDQRERQIVFLSFGRGLTQSEIAARLGYSQMHISRLLRAALDQIRREVLDVPAAA
jgi:RNA polymerase sigma-B factor